MKQGTGLINVLAALKTQTTVRPAVLPLNSTDVNGGRTIVRKITVRNNGKDAITYMLSHQPAGSALPMDPKTGEVTAQPVTKESYAQVDIFPPFFTLEARQSLEVTVRINPPADLPADEYWLYSGYVVVNPIISWDIAKLLDDQDIQQPIITVPYLGMKGNYKSLGPMSRPESGFPSLIDGKTNQPYTTDTKLKALGPVSLKNDDTPFLAVRFARPCKKFEVKILDAGNKDAELGVIPGGIQQLVGRNDASQDNMALILQWDGLYIPLDPSAAPANSPLSGPGISPDPAKTAAAIAVPDKGLYKIKVMALLPFGDPTRENSYQVWTSEAIAVDRNITLPEIDADKKKPDLPGRRVNVKMNPWLKHALGLDAPQGNLDGVSDPNAILEARQRKADMSVLPVAHLKLLTSSA